ncbi:cytochrome P450 [Ilyonectria sp. MPI-CAGE-AT-0026]|nr:cytochrome P450 [Ilyonectria sp. MPI-CAGE-AT-0026]
MVALFILAATLIYAIAIAPIASYLIDKKNLRRFPSPTFASVSSLWRVAHNVKYRHYSAVHNAHEELGSHVRIAPNHVSISDPRAVHDIYGHGANFLKDAWYDGGAGEWRHMADARVKEEHQRKRKLLAHVFAQKSLNELEPVIAETLSTLVCQINKHIEGNRVMNMRRYLNYFTIDAFSKMLYSESLHCLDRGDDIVNAETPQGKIYKVPFIKSLHDSTHINTLLGMESGLLPFTRKMFAWHPYKKAGADYENIILYNTNQRAKATEAMDDIFAKLMTKSNGDSINLPYGELLAECSVMLNAGTDTTTAALTNTIFLLYKHPLILEKLRKELDPVMSAGTIPPYNTISQLPYLRACIEESLRLRPASSMGLPRVVPKGGRTIAGHFIDEDVTVSVPTYTLLRDSTTFDRPEEYDPQRWIDGDTEKMSKVHLPFSVGPRACIGRNIAYYEQLLVIATLVTNFDFDFASADFELPVVERFNSNPGEMLLACRARVLAE